jgi:hypothetical protein
MSNIFNSDFQEFIEALNTAKVEYILVGGYSVIIHGYARTTGDMDIWVNKTEANYKRIYEAFKIFKMPVFDMTLENFLNLDKEVFRFGVPPSRIDFMTNVLGLSFDETYARSYIYCEEGFDVRVIHINDLKKAKSTSARPRDINDLENLN